MASYLMKLAARPGKRVVFSGSIPAGAGEHDYLCGRCGSPVLQGVHLRTASGALYLCTKCDAFNVIATRRPDSGDARCSMPWWDSES